jgi:imidazolonepropionase-like amidohydrolase
MLLIRGGRVLSMAGEEYDWDVVLIDEGKIRAVGMDLDAPEAEVYDAAGMVVTPGIVDAHCHIGMEEEGIGFEGEDVNEMTNPLTPVLRAIDAVNPEDPAFREAREAGITSVMHRARQRQRGGRPVPRHENGGRPRGRHGHSRTAGPQGGLRGESEAVLQP